MSSIGCQIKCGFYRDHPCFTESCRDQTWKENAMWLKKFLHICAILKEGFFKDSLELCRCSSKVLSALAAVVISLVPIGSSASREREREPDCLPGEALFIRLSGFPPSRPTTVWLGTYWSLLIHPHLPKSKKKCFNTRMTLTEICTKTYLAVNNLSYTCLGYYKETL